MDVEYRSDERLSPQEYLSFLKTSQLGSMYPRKDFGNRIARLLANAGVTITARQGGTLVGVCLGITDHAYFLFLTDLGVSRDHQRRGIGRALVERAREAAGGAEDITVVSWANAQAAALFAGLGIVPQAGLVGAEGTQWGLFDVRDDASTA